MALLSAIVATFLIIACLLQVIAYDECEETGICEHVDDYPTELVRGLIQELKIKNTLFNTDQVDERFYPSERDDVSVVSKFGLVPTLFNSLAPRFIPEPRFRLRSRFKGHRKELCQFKVQPKIPKKAKDENGIMRFIVNDEDNPVQIFYVATCNSREAKCTNSLGFIPNYKGICIQNSALREMIYIDDKNQSAIGYFKVPICCSCKLVRIN